jgi:predicted PurR-regulated permease PerM
MKETPGVPAAAKRAGFGAFLSELMAGAGFGPRGLGRKLFPPRRPFGGSKKAGPSLPVVTKRAHLVTFLGALLACLLAVLLMVGPFLLSLLLGGTLAMLAYPAYQWLEARNWGPRLAATVVTTLMLLVVFAPLTGFSILAVKQGITIGQNMAELREFSPMAITDFLSRWSLVRTVVGDPEVVNASLKSAIQSAGQLTRATVLKLGEGVPEFLLRLALALTAFFFFLLDGEQFMDWLLGLGVLDRNIQARLIESFRETTISAVLAGLAAAAALAAIIAVGFRLLDVPGAFLAGALTFIFAWIPLLGTAPALLAGLLYLYVQGSSVKMGMMVALGLGASAVDHLVRPMVLKGRAGMHPLVGVVSIISGIQMFGILGVFLGPILAALLLSLLRIWPVIGGRFGMDSTSGESPQASAPQAGE